MPENDQLVAIIITRPVAERVQAALANAPSGITAEDVKELLTALNVTLEFE